MILALLEKYKKSVSESEKKFKRGRVILLLAETFLFKKEFYEQHSKPHSMAKNDFLLKTASEQIPLKNFFGLSVVLQRIPSFFFLSKVFLKGTRVTVNKNSFRTS